MRVGCYGLAVMLLGVCACRPAVRNLEATELLLHIDASEEVRAVARKLRVYTASQTADAQAWVDRPAVTLSASAGWPFDIPVIPQDPQEPPKLVQVVAEALDAKGATLVQQRAITSFVSQAQLVLALSLARCGDRKLGELCESDAQCHGLSCQNCVADACSDTAFTRATDLTPVGTLSDGVSANANPSAAADGGEPEPAGSRAAGSAPREQQTAGRALGGAGGAGAPAAGQGGGAGAASEACLPTDPGAACDLTTQCGCESGSACNVVRIEGNMATIGCTKLDARPVSEGSVCSAFGVCQAGYGCVGPMPQTCRRHCKSDSDCQANRRCRDVTRKVDDKVMAVAGVRACFDACTSGGDCATGCCMDGVCSAADGCAVVKAQPSSDGKACMQGNTRIELSLTGSAQCIKCTVDNCCDSWVQCKNDQACQCAVNCARMPGDSDACIAACGGGSIPARYVDFGACGLRSCSSQCLNDCSATEAGFSSGTCEPVKQCGCADSENCAVEDSPDSITVCKPAGTNAPGEPCNATTQCGKGYGCLDGLCKRYCAREAGGECGTNALCSPIYHSGRLITGAFFCSHPCDPADPDASDGCRAGTSCQPSGALTASATIDDRATDCFRLRSTAVAVGPCANENGLPDSGMCAQGYYCDPSTNTCARYCHVDASDECGEKICKSFPKKWVVLGRELGACR